MKKIITAGISAGLLSGCYTMEHLGNVGEGYERGDYVSSSIMLVLTPLMLVPDVFTFGGLMDADQSAEVWTGAATQYANSNSSGSAINSVSASAGGNIDNRPVTHCVSFIAAESVAAYTAVQNKCDFDISVNWCRSGSGSDHSRCGGVLQLSGRSTERIYNPIKEAFVHAACRWPLHVYAPDGGTWRGRDGGFSCRPI